MKPFPMDSLTGDGREIGLVFAVLLGFAFGFVLERAGFGRANKLAAQFYLYDMTVFKVMFGAIVTAMLGVVIASSLGWVDLGALSEGAVSATYVWPMALGGFLLGVGFIVSGYCPGTSLVAGASGNLDGLLTVAGVFLGSVLYGELFPWVETFHTSGELGYVFLYDWLGVSPMILAAAIAGMAILAFVGAEKMERWMTPRTAVAVQTVDEHVRGAVRPRRMAWGFFGGVATLGLAMALIPVSRSAAAPSAHVGTISAQTLAGAIFHRPWQFEILDMRAHADCAKERVPGAHCVGGTDLGELGLAYRTGARTLVVIEDGPARDMPESVRGYPGNVVRLQGGYPAWRSYALEPPPALPPNANAGQRQAFKRRAAVYGALTGRVTPPPAPAAVQGFVPPKKRKGGGCE